MINPVSAKNFDGTFDYLLFDGENGTYIDVANMNNLTNYTLSARVNLLIENDDYVIFSDSNTNTTISIFDCDCPILPNVTYRLDAIVNESGKFVTCEEYVPLIFTIGNNYNSSKYIGIIDEVYIYDKPIKLESKTLFDKLCGWIMELMGM